jgi:phage terminase large subunit-like protein
MVLPAGGHCDLLDGGAPTGELEKLIVSRKLAHGGNPVSRWMAANVAVALRRW